MFPRYLTRRDFSKEELHAGISSCGFDAEDLSEVFERCDATVGVICPDVNFAFGGSRRVVTVSDLVLSMDTNGNKTICLQGTSALI